MKGEVDLLTPVGGIAALISRGWSMRQIAVLLKLREHEDVLTVTTPAPCPVRPVERRGALRSGCARLRARRQRRWHRS